MRDKNVSVYRNMIVSVNSRLYQYSVHIINRNGRLTGVVVRSADQKVPGSKRETEEL